MLIMSILVIEKTKRYVVVKIPRGIWERTDLERSILSESEALKRLRRGVSEYKAHKTKKLISLRHLRYGN